MAVLAHLLRNAVAAHHAGRLDQAERFYRMALKSDPVCFEALHGLGIVQHQAGRNERAVGFFQRALRVDDRSSALHNNLANALSALGRLEEALARRDSALALSQDDAALHHNRGNALMALSRDAEALASFSRAVALNPGLLPAWQNKAVTETRLGLHEAALATCDHLLALRPGAPVLHAKRGEALLALGRTDEALGDLDVAASLGCQSQVQANHAYALYASGQGARALAAADAALATDPEFALAHWNAASICLSLGDYARGWREYEWRWADPSFLAACGIFRSRAGWATRPDGHTILLHAEQGFGDTIQFCRYVPMVAALGARVVLEVQPALVALMRALPGAPRCSGGARLPDFDMHCPCCRCRWRSAHG